MKQCDLAVIGAGPGGYVAAIRASQLGLKTIVIERERNGGICLNWGCIPTKALLKSAEYMRFFGESKEFGFEVGDLKVDFDKVVLRSRKVSDKMSNGIGFLFKKNKVESVKGSAFIKSANLIEVKDANGEVIETIECNNMIIATGARPRMIPGIEVDRDRIITSKEALIPKSAPKSMIILGSGAIGTEFAYFYSAFGTKITIVEMMDRLLPLEDEDVSKELERHYKKYGIEVITKAKAKSAKNIGDSVEVVLEMADGSEKILSAETALNAIGVQANIEDLGLENIGIEIERGVIKVNEKLTTNVPNVYAIGDVIGAPALAHKASAEGVAVAEIIAGHAAKLVDYKNIPGCVYCNPQVASVGITEKKALEEGKKLKIGKFSFLASGKAHGIGEAKGFVKLIFDAETDLLLGAHMIGPEVTEMIAELTLARSLKAKGPDIFGTIHAHPTLSEAVMEAAAAAYGEAVNI